MNTQLQALIEDMATEVRNNAWEEAHDSCKYFMTHAEQNQEYIERFFEFDEGVCTDEYVYDDEH